MTKWENQRNATWLCKDLPAFLPWKRRPHKVSHVLKSGENAKYDEEKPSRSLSWPCSTWKSVWAPEMAQPKGAGGLVLARAGAPVRLWFLPSLLMLRSFQTCILRNFCFGFAGCVAQNQVPLVMWRQEELLGHGHTGQDTLLTLQLTFVLRYGLAEQAYNKIEKSNFD